MSGDNSVKNAEQPKAMPHPAECCLHQAGAPFGLSANLNMPPEVIGQALVCCHCGTTTVRYIGVIEGGHGRHVQYGRPTRTSPTLLMPRA